MLDINCEIHSLGLSEEVTAASYNTKRWNCKCLRSIWSYSQRELNKTSTHKSAKTRTGNIFVTRDLHLWPLTPK